MSKKFALILSTPPYDKRGAFTGARIGLASAMEGNEPTIILMEDGVYGAVAGQESKQFFQTAELLGDILEFGGKILVCGMCLIERGISKESLIPGCEVIDISKLVDAMSAADQTVFF
ncbi:MAG: DsrE family protein [Candidatus Thorarchaeota archaeon]